MLNTANYNPDVLNCLANLSSDEVFTPPKLANDILDLLPPALWSDTNATFLDPVCKSGVFLRESKHNGPCRVTTHMNGSEDSMLRPLNQYATFVRFNKAISIIEKIKAIKFDAMSESVSNRMPFGLTSKVRPTGKGEVTLYALRSVGKIARSSIHEGKNIIDSWKVLISKGYGEGGESRDYPRMIIGKPIVAVPPSACTETYLVVGTCKSKNDAQNMASYLRTKFLRFLLGLIKNTQNISRKVFAFAPMQDFSEPWTDEKLYEKYRLSKDEISFIESKIRPMEVENEK